VPEKIVEVRVGGLAMDERSKSPVVILKESQGERVLPIWIGENEAKAIALELSDKKFVRPLTHDLMKAIVEGLKSAGDDPDRITISDKEDRDLLGAGYTLRYEPPGPLIRGTVGGPNAPGYSDRVTTRGDTTFSLTNLLADPTTVIVNVPMV
jgi:hypothetical protein